MSDNIISKDDVVEKFGDLKLKFHSYYKYSFTYVGERDGYKVSVSYGGNHHDIYRHEVKADDVVELGDPTQWVYVSVRDREGNEVYSHYNY